MLKKHDLDAGDVKAVVARVHQGAIDVLGPITDPQTVHQSKFSMGTVLGLIAVENTAGLSQFDAAYKDDRVVAFRNKVRMVLDEEVDNAYPARWIGKVTVSTSDGREFHGRVDCPKGDPDNTLSRPELEQKALELAAYSGAASIGEMHRLIKVVWSLHDVDRVPFLLDGAAVAHTC